MDDILMIGFGGHAKSVADTIERCGNYRIVGYTDMCDYKCKYNYLGNDDELEKLYRTGICKAVIGVGYLGESKKWDVLVANLKRIGYEMPVIIDTTAVVSSDVVVGEGTFIGKNVVLNSGSKIGKYNIINTGAIIEHECKVGDYCHISVGAVLCGKVVVGNHVMIGANSTVIQCTKIGDDCIIGANSTILGDVEKNTKCYGILKRGK